MSSPSAPTPAVVAYRSALDAQERLNVFTQLEQADDLGALAASIVAAVRNGAVLPLAGIAVGLKDLIDHQGRVTTAGSAFYRRDAATSAPVVRRLEEAGAVIIGRTGLHEFAFGFTSENPHFGPVRNPWEPTCSPGGSSGGSGAAVAAGITPISIGTDTGGSIRVPAALCGCFGLKVTHGRIPLEGVFPLAGSLDTVGPLADGMANLEMAYRVMSGDESHQPAPHELRLGVPHPWYDDAPLDARVRVAFEKSLADLDSLGHRVEHFELPGVLPSSQLVHAMAREVNEVHEDFRARGLPYGDDVAQRLDDCAAVTPAQMDAAVAWQQTIRQSFAHSFENFDFLLTPTTPVMRKEIGKDMIDGIHHRTVLSWFTALVNHSLCPAIAMPLAGTDSPPVSLQAIGPRGSETSILAFGKSLESSGMVRFRPAPGVRE
ncbi:MAG: amidase [Acidimicrobiia bacterium]